MKQLKRLTSVLLVLGIVLGLMPLSAFAAEPEDTAETTFTVTKPDNGGVDTYTFRPLKDGTVELTAFDTTATVAYVEIPSTATSDGKEYSVTSIGNGAFAGHDELKTVKLPDSIISIGTGAFGYCSQLTTVNLGNSVRSIGENAFTFCMSMEELTIPQSIEVIEHGAFYYGYNVKKQLEILHYTGTKAQWDELMKKKISYTGDDFSYTDEIGNMNPMLNNPKEFHYAPTVSFECGDPEKKTSKVVEYEGIVTPPADPIAKGHQFDGWYTKENGGVPFDFTQPIKEDVTVYAHWSEVKPDHTVSFDCGGKAEGTSKVVQHGGTVTPPADPKADGYQFEGWYTQKDGGEEFDFSQPIKADVTVYAHWSEVKPDHTVYFDCGDQAAESTKVVVQHGETVTPPDDPKADGYRFEGWYTQENGGEPFDFNQEITEDVKVYAHWSEVKPDPKPEPKPEPEPTPTPTPDPDTDTAKKYTLTEKDGTLVRVTVVENGTPVDITENVELKKEGTTQIGKIPAGAMVTVAANAAPEGMVFAQWNISDPALMGNPDVAHTSQTMTFPMPAADVTVEAMYESAENARETELLGSAAMIGAVGISAVVLAYQAHQLGTELYLRYLLPSGATIPQNRIQLAELLWRNAGEPVPDVNAMYEDIGLNEEAAQQAAQWAVENELMELPDEEHTEQFKPDEQISYGEAIRAWKKAQQLKTAE